MIKFVATIQTGHEAEHIMPLLTQGLQNIAVESFKEHAEESAVRWKVIPKGFAWTAGRPSNSSVLMCTVPKRISFETRADFMLQVNDYWVDQTGADSHELLIFTVDDAQ
ncbi:MAG: hypothetical protein AAGD96_28950 [Chloroflexota bacterium]